MIVYKVGNELIVRRCGNRLHSGQEKFREVVRRIGREWRSLSEEEKEVYREKGRVKGLKGPVIFSNERFPKKIVIYE